MRIIDFSTVLFYLGEREREIEKGCQCYYYYKRKECESSLFGSSRGRIAAANAANAQCSTAKSVEQAAIKGQPLTVLALGPRHYCGPCRLPKYCMNTNTTNKMKASELSKKRMNII